MNRTIPDAHMPAHILQDQGRVLGLVRRFGWNATSFQVIEPGYRYFFPHADACVAYVDTGRAWVAAGAPRADAAHMEEVVAAFLAAARAAGRRACFFATEERFVQQTTLRSLLVGEQAVWNPADWEGALRASRTLREQVRRARAKGLTISSVKAGSATASELAAHATVKAMIGRWMAARELAPLGFLARVEPLALLPDHRLFVARCRSVPVGMLSVAPVYRRGGWLVQNLIRVPESPNGTAEALIDHAMREALDEGLTFVTLGMAPLAGNVRRPLALARRAGSSLYNFEGLRAFRAKLRPARWDGVFLSYPAATGGARALVDVLAAFAQGGFLRFGLRTLARGPLVIIQLLALLLVPWTLLLATPRAGRWFPGPGIHWGWVGFDLVLLAGITWLCARWRDRLARLLTVVVGCEALLTAFEGIVWNAPRAASGAVRAILVAAVAAPAAACFVLGRACRRRAGAQA